MDHRVPLELSHMEWLFQLYHAMVTSEFGIRLTASIFEAHPGSSINKVVISGKCLKTLVFVQSTLCATKNVQWNLDDHFYLFFFLFCSSDRSGVSNIINLTFKVLLLDSWSEEIFTDAWLLQQSSRNKESNAIRPDLDTLEIVMAARHTTPESSNLFMWIFRKGQACHRYENLPQIFWIHIFSCGNGYKARRTATRY